MLETICPKCQQRYPLGQDHTCPKPVARSNTTDRYIKALVVGGVDLGRVADALVNIKTAPKRGRPKTITDMKAYKALKAVEYRARKKAEK